MMNIPSFRNCSPLTGPGPRGNPDYPICLCTITHNVMTIVHSVCHNTFHLNCMVHTIRHETQSGRDTYCPMCRGLVHRDGDMEGESVSGSSFSEVELSESENSMETEEDSIETARYTDLSLSQQTISSNGLQLTITGPGTPHSRRLVSESDASDVSSGSFYTVVDFDSDSDSDHSFDSSNPSFYIANQYSQIASLGSSLDNRPTSSGSDSQTSQVSQVSQRSSQRPTAPRSSDDEYRSTDESMDESVSSEVEFLDRYMQRPWTGGFVAGRNWLQPFEPTQEMMPVTRMIGCRPVGMS